MNDVFLLLGSNIEKERNLPAAVRLLAKMVDLKAVSPVYESAPVGLLEQPPFFNAVVRIQTRHDAVTIKREIIGRIERELKRVRQADKNAPRTIDADIVLFNDEVFEYDGRHVPDPDLLKFPHVAVPLADLAPEMTHPETGEPLAEIAARLLAEMTEKAGGDSPLWPRPDIDLRPAARHD